MSRDVVKQELLAKLKQEHCFWSYNENLIKDIPDDMLIEKTLLHLDLEEINQLFLIYPFKKIKQVWLDYLVPQAEYLYTLNRFFAWYYFKAKKPDAYIKSMATRHLEAVSKLDCIKSYLLVGGTALSLQMGTRQSEDLDFMKWRTSKTEKMEVAWYQIEKQ